MKKSVILKSLVVTALLAVALLAVFAFGSCSDKNHTHSYIQLSVLQEPTCSEIGVRREACECGDFQLREIPKAEHTAGEWKTLYEETCITKGTRQLLCQICNAVMKVEVVPTLGHDLISYERKEPTCATVGHEEYQACTRCSYSTYREISKTKHTVDPDSKYPTCTEPLLCQLCEAVVEPATGHIEIVTTGTPATCEREGKTDYIECLSCGIVLQESIKITKREHTIIELPAVMPTCTSTGRTYGQQCTECGDYVISPTYVSKTPHKYSNNSDAECNDCGFLRRVGSGKCVHSRTTPIIKIDTGCVKFGVTSGVECIDCGEVITGQNVVGKDGKVISNISGQTVANLPAHTVEIMPAVAPTQTRPGLTEGKKCATCKTIIVQQEVIAPLSMAGKTE